MKTQLNTADPYLPKDSTMQDKTPSTPQDAQHRDSTLGAPRATEHAPIEQDNEPDNNEDFADEQDKDDTQDTGSKAAREAAKLRKRAQAAEAERDRLTAQVDVLIRSHVEYEAARHIAKPAALWAIGTEPTHLLTDDGTVDPVKVKEACLKARDELGLGGNRGNYVPNEGLSPRNPSRDNNFAAAFKPN